MNSNKTSLKSQLIRLGLVVPLALVSVGAYAAAPTAAEIAKAAENKALPVDFAHDDAATDFSDSFEVGDEATTKALVTAVEANPVLKTYFAAGHEAGQDLINFQAFGITDGVVSVQVGAGSSTLIFDNAKTSAAAATEKLGDLKVSANSIALGTGSASSTNGSDQLVLGGFVGYGAIGFASKLHHKIDKDGNDTTDSDGDGAEDKAFNANVVAKSSGFGGGLFASYKADADSPLGLFANATVRYTQLTHLLTTKKIDSVIVAYTDATDATKTTKEDRLVKTQHGYKNGAVVGDLGVGYTLKAAEVKGFPILVKATANIGVDYDKFESGEAAAGTTTTTKPVVLISQKFGLNLSTVLLDGKLFPSIGVSLVKKAALESQAKEFGGIPAPTAKDAKFKTLVHAGVGYHFNDTITVSLGGMALVKAKAKEGEEDKAGSVLGVSGINFGLSYRF